MGESYDAILSSVERPNPHAQGDAVFWRTDDPIFDSHRNLIRGGMFPHQREFWYLTNFIKVLVGGYGSGKTAIGSKRIISLALENAPIPVAAVSPAFPQARRTIIPALCELLEGKRKIFGKKFWWRYNKSVHEFHIRYHGRAGHILVLSGEKPHMLRGSNLAAAWMDEPFMQEQAVFDQMMARVRHPQAVLPELLLTGTAEQLNWGYDLCLGDLRETNDVGFVQASTRANKALDDSYVRRLMGVFTDRAAEAYIDGKFVNLSAGQVYYSFSSANVTDKEIPIPEGAELGAGMDFNVNPMSACVFWKQGDRIHYFDEIELPNADTEYMCSVLRERYVDNEKFAHNPLRCIYPDATGIKRHTAAPAGKSDFHFIRDSGFELVANRGNPLRKDRYNAVNGKFRPKAGPISLTISPGCKKLAKYMNQYTHEQMHKQESMSHLLDAFSYPIAYLFPISRDLMAIKRLTGV